MAAANDTVVCTTAFAGAEFDRIGAANVRRVPLGVDLATFSPRHRDGGLRLVVAGDGPRRAALERRAAGLPVTFVGFVPQRRRLARLLASADVSIAPGPHETFGLSALEALASGTPVVVSRSSALTEIVTGGAGGFGATVADSPEAFAAGITTVLAADETGRRHAARCRAEQFGWPSSVDGMLATLTAS